MKHLVHADSMISTLAKASVSCIFTSPPYPRGARDYGVSGYGLEKTIDCEGMCKQCYACNTERWLVWARSVLHKSGTLYLNIPELYHENREVGLVEIVKKRVRQAGLFVAMTIPWIKTNAVPKTGRRPTSRMEYVLMITKSPGDNYYDKEANRVKSLYGSSPRLLSDIDIMSESVVELVNEVAAWATQQATIAAPATNQYGGYTTLDGTVIAINAPNVTTDRTNTASFPRRLVKPLLSASLPPAVCARCKQPYEREIAREVGSLVDRSKRSVPEVQGNSSHGTGASTLSRNVHVTTKGWSPTCDCDCPSKRAVFVDLFCGTGTAVEVASEMGAIAVGMDLDFEQLLDNKRAWSVDMPVVKNGDDVSGLPLFTP